MFEFGGNQEEVDLSQPSSFVPMGKTQLLSPVDIGEIVRQILKAQAELSESYPYSHQSPFARYKCMPINEADRRDFEHNLKPIDY